MTSSLSSLRQFRLDYDKTQSPKQAPLFELCFWSQAVMLSRPSPVLACSFQGFFQCFFLDASQRSGETNVTAADIHDSPVKASAPLTLKFVK